MSLAKVAIQKDWIEMHKEFYHNKKPQLSCEKAHNQYLAQKILNDIRNWKTVDLIKDSYFNKLELFNYPSICVLIDRFLDQDIKQTLLNIVFLSRSSKEVDLACSNAITILAKSDFSFNDIDLSNIRIPKADLSQCLLINVNFENSNLKEVKILQSQLYKVNFKNCDLSNAKFGFVMKINSQNGKGLFFSADDNYFYYKADGSLMEMDLKNQQIKSIATLSDFVSSHIIKVYRMRDNISFSRLHTNYLEIWAGHKQKKIFDLDMNKIAFSSNWKYLAGLTDKSIAFCWDKENEVLGATRTATYTGIKLSFSPCIKYLVIIRRTFIYIIKTETWMSLKTIRGKFSNKCCFAFSYCGKKIAISNSGKLVLIDIATEVKTTIKKFNLKHWASELSFSPCGRFLAFACDDNTTHVIEINTGNTTQMFTTGFDSNVVSILFSNSGKYISLSDSDGNTKIYEFFPKFIKNDFNLHLKILEAKISPKGTYLITKSTEKSVLWEMRGFKPKQIKIFFDTFDLYVFSASENYLATRICQTLQIYDIKHNYWVSAKEVDYCCFFMTFSHCEQYLICLDGIFFEYFRISDMEMVRKVDTQQLGWPFGFSNCGKYHYWFDTNYDLLIWDLEKDNFINRIVLDQNYMKHAFTPLLTQIAVTNGNFSTKECLEVWDREFDKTFLLKAEGESINCCCFSPNEKYIVVGYESGSIIIWDIKNELIIEKFRSLLCRCFDTIDVVNNSIIIKEIDNVEIFKSNQLN